MFGESSEGRPCVGRVLLVGVVGAAELGAIVLFLLLILAPLGDALRAIARDKLPTFEEEILVVSPRDEPVASGGNEAPSPVEPAAHTQPAPGYDQGSRRAGGPRR